jgi:lauroyl/myristoyl acyltransferase
MPTHKKPESERFKGPVKWCQYVLARAVVSLLQRLPVTFAFWLGRKIGWLCWKLMKRRRATVRKNLEIVNKWMDAQSADGGAMMANGGESERKNKNPHHSSAITHPSSLALPLEAQVKEVFQRAGANLFAGFTFNRMCPERIEKHIRIEGIEHLKEALTEGKGAIILLAHMGPWEALSQLPSLAIKHDITAPFGAMYRPLNNTYLDDWFKQQREASGTRLFSRRDGFHKPVDFIRGGGMLGILADQKMREGVVVPYFGSEAKTSPIPGLFLRRSQAPLLAVSIETLAPARWKIRVRQVELPEGLDDSKRAILAEQCNQVLELSLAQSVSDGFWLTSRFKKVDGVLL